MTRPRAQTMPRTQATTIHAVSCPLPGSIRKSVAAALSGTRACNLGLATLGGRFRVVRGTLLVIYRLCPWEHPPDDQVNFRPNSRLDQISPGSIRDRFWTDSLAASRRRQIDIRPNLFRPRQARRGHGGNDLGISDYKVFHQILAHIRLYDCLRLSGRTADSVASAPFARCRH